MVMIGKIRRMYFRDKKSLREIARSTSLSRSTVRKWLKAPVNNEPKYRRSARPNKLTPFHEAIQRALKADALRPRQERRTALALYNQIKVDGYSGGYSRVTDFIRECAAKDARDNAACRRKVRLLWPIEVRIESKSIAELLIDLLAKCG